MRFGFGFWVGMYCGIGVFGVFVAFGLVWGWLCGMKLGDVLRFGWFGFGWFCFGLMLIVGGEPRVGRSCFPAKVGRRFLSLKF